VKTGWDETTDIALRSDEKGVMKPRVHEESHSQALGVFSPHVLSCISFTLASSSLPDLHCM